jgi:Domain of unknown function (DUF1707)
VSNLPISSPYRSTPDVPVSEVERNQLSARLNDAYSDGAIDADAYRDRLDRLFAAQKLGDLVPVVDGLPPLQTYVSPAIVAGQGGEPGQLTQSRNAGGLAVVAVGVLVGVILLIAILLLILL